MNNYRKISLSKLQPSQLYISQEKLHSVNLWLDSLPSYDSVILSVIVHNNDVIIIDGHTRAYALWCRGIENVWIKEEAVNSDLYEYLTCVSWCKSEGIYRIKDLHHRSLPQSEYELLWIKRCEALFQ